jgi:hypothetical protein
MIKVIDTLMGSGKTNGEFIIYFMKDDKDNILYIGKTTNLKTRISQHFNKEECEIRKWKQEVKCIELLYFDNPIDMSIYEIYYINKYNPIYNKECNYIGFKSNLHLNDIYTMSVIMKRDDFIFSENTQYDINNLKNKEIEILYIKRHEKTKEDYCKDESQIKKDISNIYISKGKNASVDTTFLYNCTQGTNKNILPIKYIKFLNNNLKNCRLFYYIGEINLNNGRLTDNINVNIYKIIQLLSQSNEDKIQIYIQSKKIRNEFKLKLKERRNKERLNDKSDR